MDRIIAGVDEAGRGPLAGPVFAAAVILRPTACILGLTDSKLLTEKQREKIFQEIMTTCVTYGVGFSSVAEIDEINILQASLLAMRRAIAQLPISPQEVWVDGNQDPRCGYTTKLIVQGDFLVPCISAASIVAKVTRDRVMKKLDEQFPGYGFAKHKGYGTKEHMKMLKTLGPTEHHRRSFAPVRESVISDR